MVLPQDPSTEHAHRLVQFGISDGGELFRLLGVVQNKAATTDDLFLDGLSLRIGNVKIELEVTSRPRCRVCVSAE